MCQVEERGLLCYSWNSGMNEWMNEVVYFKSGYGGKTFTIVHGLEKHASPDLTGAKSHQKNDGFIAWHLSEGWNI